MEIFYVCNLVNCFVVYVCVFLFVIWCLLNRVYKKICRKKLLRNLLLYKKKVINKSFKEGI